MMNRVVVVGSYNVDMTITTDVLPKAGETVIGKSLHHGHGGKGANQALAAVRAGAEVSFFAKVGSDQYGQQAITCLAREGIGSEYIFQEPDTATGMAFITVNNLGENSIVVSSGANWTLSETDIENHAEIFSDADILLTQLETPITSVAMAIKKARQNNLEVILNPAPAQSLTAEFLKDVSIITPNRVEAELISGVSIRDDKSLADAANVIHSLGVEIVLITLGDRGVFISKNGEQQLLPAIKTKAIDTVGAGDVFSGYLAANYSGLDNLLETVTLASAAASLSVTRIGAQNAIPSLKEVNSYLKKHALLEKV
ncbi:MAG: ribokinase [Candidatus Marinimicrobia bacterium]|nr:ribokinase [Candidatus Neomarinimicrobiota bacterium]